MRTTPITIDDFWPLFSEWCQTRLNLGHAWLPSGWDRWVTEDFNAFALHHTVQRRMRGESAFGYDIQTQRPSLMGSPGNVSMILNGRHSDHRTWFIDFICQSMHETHRAIYGRTEFAREQLQTLESELPYGDVHGALVLMVFDPEVRTNLERHHHSVEQFSFQLFEGSHHNRLYVMSSAVERSFAE